PSVYGDEDRITQILYNLVGNAIKFTQTGTVAVHATEKEDFIELSVSDTGIGIPQGKINQIFQAFVQADGSIQRQYSGTGLGLSITKNLVELHGGKIWVESQVGEGSTFYVTFPKSHEKAVIRPALSMVSTSVQNGHEEEKFVSESKGETLPTESSVLFQEDKQVRILIADDEPVNLQVLINHLSDLPYQITTAVNGEEAIEILDEQPDFDLVLLDVMMPQMSGFRVCQHIREKYLPSELPVIMITAKNQVADLVEGLSYGANDYVVKPFSKDELLSRIKTHLNLYKISKSTARFVPNEFLRSLGYETITEVRLGDQVEKDVTVFFSDIRSYTTLAETMTPAQNFKFVNAFSGRMGPVIRKYNGFVNQYLGDGIMALFLKSPDDAVKAAIEMQREILTYNKERKQHERRPIKVGMGLHTGSLIMGIIGDNLRTDAATISDTVNTASRMEGLTKFYGANLLVSETTLAQLKDPNQFNYRYLGRVRVKGKKQSVGVYDFFDGDLSSEMTL
ncbi:MAG: response regulator, partial [Bacteroidetes bacterium]|nr:response regulator [Bacteroidota bacterium]